MQKNRLKILLLCCCVVSSSASQAMYNPLIGNSWESSPSINPYGPDSITKNSTGKWWQKLLGIAGMVANIASVVAPGVGAASDIIDLTADSGSALGEADGGIAGEGVDAEIGAGPKAGEEGSIAAALSGLSPRDDSAAADAAMEAALEVNSKYASGAISGSEYANQINRLENIINQSEEMSLDDVVRQTARVIQGEYESGTITADEYASQMKYLNRLSPVDSSISNAIVSVGSVTANVGAVGGLGYVLAGTKNSSPSSSVGNGHVFSNGGNTATYNGVTRHSQPSYSPSISFGNGPVFSNGGNTATYNGVTYHREPSSSFSISFGNGPVFSNGGNTATYNGVTYHREPLSSFSISFGNGSGVSNGGKTASYDGITAHKEPLSSLSSSFEKTPEFSKKPEEHDMVTARRVSW